MTSDEKAPAPAASMRDFRDRALLTIALLLAYRIGFHIPIPGLAPDALARISSMLGTHLATERVSLFALGIMPFLTALIMGEIGALVFPSVRRWRDGAAAPGSSYPIAIATLGLLLAALQGAGLAGAVEMVAGLVGESGVAFHTAAILSWTAGTAIAIWLAAAITRHGLGNGVWMLLLATALPRWADDFGSVAALARDGLMASGSVLLLAALPLAILAALLALLEARHRSGERDAAWLAWPGLVAGVLMGFVIAAGWLFPVGALRSFWIGSLSPGGPLFPAALAAVVAGLTFVYARRAESAAGLLWPTVAVVTAAVVLPQLVAGLLAWPVFVEGSFLVVLAVVGFDIATRWRGLPAPAQ